MSASGHARGAARRSPLYGEIVEKGLPRLGLAFSGLADQGSTSDEHGGGAAMSDHGRSRLLPLRRKLRGLSRSCCGHTAAA